MLLLFTCVVPLALDRVLAQVLTGSFVVPFLCPSILTEMEDWYHRIGKEVFTAQGYTFSAFTAGNT